MVIEVKKDMFFPGTPVRNSAGHLGTFIEDAPDGLSRFIFAPRPLAQPYDALVTRQLASARYRVEGGNLTGAERFTLGLSFPERVLSELRRVGPAKPLGFLGVSRIIDAGGVDPQALINEAKMKGLVVLLDKYGAHDKGTLFFYDRDPLREVLTKNADILRKFNWPDEPHLFVVRVKQTPAPPKTRLFDLVADLMDEPTKPGRLYLPDGSLAPTIVESEDRSSWRRLPKRG